MKTPVVYEIAGNLRCLLVEDGQKISIGSAAECDVQIDGDAVHDVEKTVQFVNGCQSVRILCSNGGAPNEQPLPWTIPLAGFDLVFYRPLSSAGVPEAAIEREITLQGLTGGKIRHVLTTNQPLLLGSSEDCDVVISSSDCPAVQLAFWAAADNKVAVQVLDNSSVVDWLGRANATKAELELPASLSLGGKIIRMVNGDESSSTQRSVPALPPAGPPTLAEVKPPSTVDDEFYINKNRQQHGPFSEEEVRRSVHRGTYSANDLAWKEGEEDWVPLNKLISISGPPRFLPPPADGTQNHSTLAPQVVVSTNIVSPQTASPRGVIIASWVLIVLLCGGAFIPGLGFGTWALVWPFMLTTFILGIIALARRATVQGVMILLATIFVVPAVIFVAPFLSTFVATVAVGTAAATAAQKTVESVPELQESIEQLGKSVKVVQDLSDDAKIVTDQTSGKTNLNNLVEGLDAINSLTEINSKMAEKLEKDGLKSLENAAQEYARDLETLQNKLDKNLSDNAKMVTSSKSGDLSKGPQSNVNASTAPRSTDDSSGSMAKQPISNENQRPELPANASKQIPVVEKNNKTNEQQVVEDFQREINNLAGILRKRAAARATSLQTYLEDAPKISFVTTQPGLQSNEICAIAHHDGWNHRLFFGDELKSVGEFRDPNLRIGAAAKSPLGTLIKRVGDVMGFDRMEDIPNVLINLMLHSPRIADPNIRTEALRKSEVFRGVIIGDDALSVITQIFKSNSFIYNKTFSLSKSQVEWLPNSIVIHTTTKVFDEYCNAVFIFVPPNEFEDADFVTNISSLKSYRLVGLEIDLANQNEAQRAFNEYIKKAMYGKTAMVWTASDRELLKSLGLGDVLEKQDLQSLNQAADTIVDVMKYANAMNAQANRSGAFLDQFKISAQNKYENFELRFEDISWQDSGKGRIIYFCKNKIPQMVLSSDFVSDDSFFFSKDRVIFVRAKDCPLRFYHNALLIQNDASSVMRDCIDYLQSKIDDDERKLNNTKNGDFK